MQVENGEIKLDYGEVLVRSDVFKTSKGEIHLVGRKCKKCGDISFPPYRYCMSCDSPDETEECVLDNNWILYSYTQAFMVTPGFEPGYILGLVGLAGHPDVRITAQLCDCTTADLTKDMPLELTLRVIQQNLQGSKVVSYCFRPRKNN